MTIDVGAVVAEGGGSCGPQLVSTRTNTISADVLPITAFSGIAARLVPRC
jgi:hypothetical protein